MIVLCYLSICLLFGTVFLFTKIGLTLGWPPFLFSGIRFAAAGFILILVTYLIKRMKLKTMFQHQLKIVLIGVFMTGIPFAAVYWGLQYVDSGIVAVLVSTGPFFIYVLEAYNGKENVSIHHLIGIALCTSGIVMMSAPAMDFFSPGKRSIAIVSLILSEVFFAVGSLKAKALLTEKQVDSFLLTGFQMVYGGCFLLCIDRLFDPHSQIPTTMSSFLVLLYFIFVASILTYSMYYWLIQKTNAFVPATQSYISPLIALVVGTIVLGESFTLFKILASLFIVTGIFFIYVRGQNRTLQTPKAKEG